MAATSMKETGKVALPQARKERGGHPRPLPQGFRFGLFWLGTHVVLSPGVVNNEFRNDARFAPSFVVERQGERDRPNEFRHQTGQRRRLSQCTPEL